MLSFHTTLEAFFHKTFHDEIERLAVESHDLVSARPDFDYQPPASAYSTSINRRSFDALDVSRPPSVSPSTQTPLPPLPDGPLSAKQTPLQRGLAHLARHGFNGVASGPRDNTSDFEEISNPHDSYMNGAGGPVANLSGAASVTASTMGSMGSLRGRFSRLGSLNFGRRDG